MAKRLDGIGARSYSPITLAGYVRRVRDQKGAFIGIYLTIYRGRTLYCGPSYIFARHVLLEQIREAKYRRGIRAARREAMCNWIDLWIDRAGSYLFRRDWSKKS